MGQALTAPLVYLRLHGLLPFASPSEWDWPGLQDMGLAQIHSIAGEALSCILAGVPLSKKRWVSSIKGFQNLIQASLNQ